MPNVSNFGTQTDNAVVQGTVTDRAMVIPDIPPQGLMSVGPRVTPNFVKPSLWSALTTYHFFDVVHDAAGASYVAIKPEVPAGTEVTDENYWFLWADPNSQFAELSELVKTFNGRISQNTADIATKAPNNHASEDSTYGVGNEVNYGHVRLAMEDTPLTSGANDGIAATPSYVANRLAELPLASAIGFSSDADKANDNSILFNSLTKCVYADIDIPFAKKLEFTPTKYITGEGKLIYTGAQDTDNFFVSMGEVPSGQTTYRGKNINICVDCNDNINGISWHGGIYNKIALTVFNPARNGVSIEANSPTSMPSYGNDYTVKAHTYKLIEGDSVGLAVNASDDNYICETGNFKVGLTVNRGNNTFPLIHNWIAKPELWQDSKCISINFNNGTGNGKFGSIVCDTMQTAIEINDNAFISIDYLQNWWSTNSAKPYTGADRPFVINQQCELAIDTLHWIYKEGTYDAMTGLSNCNIQIQPNDKYAAITNCTGITFIGNVTNAPCGHFRILNTSTTSTKYTNLPSTYIENDDSNCLSIELFSEQNAYIRRYVFYRSSDPNIFISQTYRGNNTIKWFRLNMTEV